MENFLGKYVYIHISVDVEKNGVAEKKHFYYTCAKVTQITDTHISFDDDNSEPCTYRKEDVVEIKLSRKNRDNIRGVNR